MKRIAVFGGSFDPVHEGHLRIINAVQDQVKPDVFLLIPCGNPPHREALVADSYQRLKMLHLASKNLAFVKIDTREIDSGELSYTYLTLSELGRENPDSLLMLVMGWDSLVSFTTWAHWREILRLSCILVVGRAGDKRQLPVELASNLQNCSAAELKVGDILQLDFEEICLSSTEIRQALMKNVSIDSFLPPSVSQYIKAENIYSGC